MSDPQSFRERLFSDWRPEWILAEDEALIVIDKPPGVPAQSAREEDDDDVRGRLGRYLMRRDGLKRPPYLGVHQRLDRDTSGVMLFTLDRAVNGNIAKQFEGRTVDKRYVAAVRGDLKKGPVSLRHYLKKHKGNVEVFERPQAKAKRAVTIVSRRERNDDRHLCDVAIETGRTHQIRAQLAANGTPVAGDGQYGKVRAPRLMLHSRALTLKHPLTDREVTFEAPLPPCFATWLTGSDHELPAEISRETLQRALERRYALRDTPMFRLLHGISDGASSLEIDVYGEHLVASLYHSLDDDEEARLFDTLDGLGFAGVYLKRRPKQSNELVDARASKHAPAEVVRGREAPDPVILLEHGLKFALRLGDGMSTGIFLDQRDARLRVIEHCAASRDDGDPVRVLNLFAYTGAFSVGAASAGATTTTVDVSAAALDRAQSFFALNEIDVSAHEFIVEDAFDALLRFIDNGRLFDLVICDPPTHATTKSRRWKSGPQWIDLVSQCLRVTRRGGALLLSSNDRRMAQARFRRYVHEGAREAGVNLDRVRDLAPSRDFPIAAGGYPHLKRVWVEAD